MTEPTSALAAPVVQTAEQAADWKNALAAITSPDTNPVELYVNPAIKTALWGASKMMATSKFLPERFFNKPEEVFIGLTVAARLGVDPLALFPQFYTVLGNPSVSSKFKIQLANQRGPFEGGIRFEMFGEAGTPTRGCRAYAKYKGEDRYAESVVTIETAKRAGWMSKNGSWWAISPDKMLRYRAGGWLVDEYCPEVSMGMMTKEEADDIAFVAPPKTAPASALLNDERDAAPATDAKAATDAVGVVFGEDAND